MIILIGLTIIVLLVTIIKVMTATPQDIERAVVRHLKTCALEQLWNAKNAASPDDPGLPYVNDEFFRRIERFIHGNYPLDNEYTKLCAKMRKMGIKFP
jgi:hypothetical protein